MEAERVWQRQFSATTSRSDFSSFAAIRLSIIVVGIPYACRSVLQLHMHKVCLRPTTMKALRKMSVAKELVASISTSLNLFRGYFVPVFKVLCDGTPYHAGTAFGIEHKGARYMVTASHAFEKDESNPCDSKDELFVAVNGALTQIRQFDRTTVHAPAQPQRTPIPLDLVIISPRDFDLSAVFSHFFKREHWHKSRLHNRLYAAACGFPATKPKESCRKNRLEIKHAPLWVFRSSFTDSQVSESWFQ